MANIFMQNFSKAGSGIAKKAHKRHDLKLFFEIYGTHMWKLFGLNFLYLLFCIPIITIGPATAALVKLLKNYSIDKHVNILSDFWSAFKQNFVKGFFWGLINMISFALMSLGTRTYSNILENRDLLSAYHLPDMPNIFFRILTVLTISVGIVLIMVNFYYFLMMVSTNLGFKDRLKNSFALVMVAPKENLLTLFVFVTIPFIALCCLLSYTAATVIGFLLFFIFVFTFIWFTVCFNCYPIVQKYVINPYYEARGEQNPELEAEPTADDEEVIFKDMGGLEQPTDLNGGKNNGSKKRKEKLPSTPKGKVIK